MFELTPERLQVIAVKCVSQFITKQASLNEALSKEAQELELNSEQIKRAVETTNTLAYLRQLEGSSDRTSEFPVASYKEVIACMVMPEKQAESKDKDGDKVPVISGMNHHKNVMIPAKVHSSTSEQEKVAMLAQETFRCRATLTKMAYDKTSLVLEIEDCIYKFKQDVLCMEKLAEVSEEDIFPKLVKLCGLEGLDLEKRSLDCVFLDKELIEAHRLHSLYKEAKALIETEREMEVFVKRASAVLIEKQAFLGALGSLAGRAIGGIAGVGSTVKAGKSAIESVNSFGNAAKKTGFTGSTRDAVKKYDKISATKGSGAAMEHFGGKKPSMLGNRIGVGEVAMAGLTGTALHHENNVWNSLHN